MAINFDNVMNYANQNKKKKKKEISIDNVMNYANQATNLPTARDVNQQILLPTVETTQNDTATFGTFSNGYQPKGIDGHGSLSKTGQTINVQIGESDTYNELTGKKDKVFNKQNVWKAEDGTKWVWDGTTRTYKPYGESAETGLMTDINKQNVLPTVEQNPKLKQQIEAGAKYYKERENQKLFKTTPFDDGYQFGDITKTILGTAGDVAVDVGKGAIQLGQGIGKTGAYGVAQIAEWTGNDEYAEKVRKKIGENPNPVLDKVEDLQSKTIDKYSVLGDKADQILQSVGYTGTLMGVNGLGGEALNNFTMFLSSTGDSISDTLQENPEAENWQVWLRSGANGGVSVLTESLGGIFGNNKIVGNWENKAYKKLTEEILGGAGKVFARLGIDAASEASEEFIEYALNQLTDLGIDGISALAGSDVKFHKDWNWEEVGESMAMAFASTVLLNGSIDATKIAAKKAEAKANGQDISTKEAINMLAQDIDTNTDLELRKSELERTIKSESKKGNNTTELQNELTQINKMLGVEEKTNEGNITQASQSNISDFNNQVQQTTQEYMNQAQNQVREQTRDITQNLMQSIENYNNSRQEGQEIFDLNNEQNKNELSAIQKVANDRKINIEFNANRFTDNTRNAFYEYDNNGNIAKIVLNPNSASKKYVQDLVVHELVHSFSGKQQQKLINDVFNYAKTLEGFDKAYQDIRQSYEEVYGKNVSEDVINEEVVANILGQKLGSQEFINDLVNGKYATQNRNWVQKIYDFVKNQINRFRGYKDQERYWTHIKEMFDDAYRNSEINKQGNKYSIGGRKAIENAIKQGYNYDEAIKYYNQAVDMANQSIDNEKIRQETGWFQDKKGDWKFEFSDKDMNLKISPEHIMSNRIYDLEDLISHNMLFKFYPELSKQNKSNPIKVEFKKIASNKRGGYNREHNKITINSRLLNLNEAQRYIEETLLHETQHAIQKIEGFEHGTSIKKGIKQYKNSLGEIEAKDIEKRFYKEKYLKEDIAEAPESSKKNPKPLDLKKESIIDKIRNKLSEFWEEDNKYENDIETIEKMDSESKRKDSRLVVARTLESKDSKQSSFSLQKDNQGRKLSKEQAEYFKDSKVRDEDGNLLTMYHSTDADFNTFTYDNLGKTGLAYGRGFYFTDSEKAKNAYGQNTKTVYLDIQKPMEIGKRTMSKSDYKKLVEAVNNKTNGVVEADYGSIEDAVQDYEYGGDDIDLVNGLKNESGLSDKVFYDLLRETLGYDGIKANNQTNGEDGNYWIAFNANQIKNVDNTNPTTNEDIRFSKDTSGDWNNFLEKNFKKEGTGTSIKDMKVLPTKQITMQDFEDAINEYNFPSKDANDLKNDLKYVEMNKQSLDEFKDFLRTYNEAYQETLQSKEDEVLDTTKTYSTGRKEIYRNYLNDNSKYDKTALEKAKSAVPGKQGRRTKEQWLLVARQIGTEIANKSNEEIEKIAYRSWIDEAPNQKSQLNRQGEKFVKFNSDDWINAIYNQVKDVRQSYSIETNLPTAEQTEKESNLPKVQSKNSMSDIPETKLSQKQTDTEVAEIMKEPEKYNKEDRRWAIFKANLIDKGIVFENLDDQMLKLAKSNNKKAKNTRTLQSAWDYLLLSGSRSQNAIANARYEFENGKQTQTSKALTEIMEEVGENTEDFYNYMYHQLNVDRMTLDKRIGIENKPVFGDSVTADMSRQRIAELEKKHPEFKEYAQDVYDYLKTDKQELVKSGVISQELADKFDEYYPHYVPISRVGKNKNVISVPLDTKRTGVNAPIKGAKGGSSNINPLFETMASRTEQTYRASARNELGLKLKNILSEINQLDESAETTNIDDIMDSIDDDNRIIKQDDKNKNPTFTIFDKGQKTTFDIDMNIYDALKTRDDGYLLNKQVPILNQINNVRRGLLTEYNPIFSLTNAMKDAQDVLINSQHPAKTYAKLPESYHQILSKGYWYNEYLQNGGESNSYFRDGEFSKEIKGQENKFKKIATMPLQAISAVNNVIEMSPRLAEYIASRESGRSVAESMLDASRVTTNFKAGGDFTKFLNRNGATFLNASVQGMVQQVRNIKEANQKGFKGWLNLALRYATAGAPVLLLNKLLWDDDDDYEELSDYIKDNYYIIAKYGDGKFIRLPKGRTVSSIQKIITNVDEYMNNKKEVNIDNVTRDVLEDLGFFWDNTAPNSVSENNIIAPFVQVSKNTSWYGEDIVPSRLQNVPEAEQYDESIDEFSKWIGQTFNVSPYKVNYLIDQYSGGLGDVLLPMSTQQAESGLEGASQLVAPLVDKFTADSTMKNQNVSDFYSLSEELTKNANSANATNEDILKNKYINRIKNNMQDLYKEKREIQNSNLGNKEKYEQVREVQKQIVDLAKEGLSNYENIKDEYGTYEEFDFSYKNPEKYKWLEDNDISYKKYQNNKEEYDYAYKNPEKYDWLENNNIDYDEYIENKDAYNNAYSNPEKYELSKLITKDYTQYYQYKKDINDLKSDGTTERKQKVISYVNSLNLSVPQKAMLIRQEYKTYNNYNSQIIQYINSLNITRQEKKQYLEELGFTVDSNFNITW